jgi:hypothetical protein
LIHFTRTPLDSGIPDFNRAATFAMREASLLSSEEIGVNAIAATARLNRSSSKRF